MCSTSEMGETTTTNDDVRVLGDGVGDAGGEAAVVLHVRDLAEERPVHEALGVAQRQLRRRHLGHRLPLLLVHPHVGRVRQLLPRRVQAQRHRQRDQPQRHIHRHVVAARRHLLVIIAAAAGAGARPVVLGAGGGRRGSGAGRGEGCRSDDGAGVAPQHGRAEAARGGSERHGRRHGWLAGGRAGGGDWFGAQESERDGRMKRTWVCGGRFFVVMAQVGQVKERVSSRWRLLCGAGRSVWNRERGEVALEAAGRGERGGTRGEAGTRRRGPAPPRLHEAARRRQRRAAP